MKKQRNAVIFDKQYSQEKIKEALGVNMAVITGACNKCPYLRKCESDNTFIFPKDAYCRKGGGGE